MTVQPSVGRIVHYVSYGTPGGEYTSQCRAAIVTDLANDEEPGVEVVGRAGLNPPGMFFNRAASDEGGTSDTPGAPAARSYRGGTWHWPERVA